MPSESFEVGGLTCEPVPHRNEDADTVGLRFDDGNSSVSDIDYWTPRWSAVKRSDMAFVDGTLYSTDEVDGRDVPHPPILETMTRFEDCETDVRFTHLNHSNPVADPSLSEYCASLAAVSAWGTTN